MTQPAEAPKPRSRVRSGLTLTVEILTVLTAIIALLDWTGIVPGVIGPDERDKEQAQSQPQPTAQLTTPAGLPPAQTGVTYLDTLTPIIGGSRLTAVPAAGAGDFSRAIAIKCPTNQTGDKRADVTFELRRRFGTFTTTIFGYQEPAAPNQLRLTVFHDPPDRQPGGPDPVESQSVQLAIGENKPLNAGVSATFNLRLSLVCDDPRSLVILNQATLS
jgi:hypothetical protein